MKIMIVDDDSRIRDVIRSILAGHDAEFCECGDAPNALALYESCRPDWVLMDIEMIGMDGITATREISKLDPKARVIIVTHYDVEELRDAATSAGACGFVNKENLQEVNSIISRGSARPGDRNGKIPPGR